MATRGFRRLEIWLLQLDTGSVVLYLLVVSIRLHAITVRVGVFMFYESFSVYSSTVGRHCYLVIVMGRGLLCLVPALTWAWVVYLWNGFFIFVSSRIYMYEFGMLSSRLYWFNYETIWTVYSHTRQLQNLIGCLGSLISASWLSFIYVVSKSVFLVFHPTFFESTCNLCAYVLPLVFAITPVAL